MSSFSQLVVRQQDLFRIMSNSIINLKKKGEQNITEAYVQGRLDVLLRSWDKFEANHEAMLDQRTADNEKNEYFVQDLRSMCEEVFLDNQATLCDYLKRLSPPATTSTHSAMSTGGEKPQVVYTRSHPRIDLPKCSGDYKEWPAFRGLFESLVIREESFSPVQRLQYLRTNLGGEALPLINNIPVHGDNFERAWKVITRRYDNRRALIETQLDLLFSMGKASTDSAADLKRLHGTVVQVREALEGLECKVEHWDPIVVYWVARCLDDDSVRAWVERAIMPHNTRAQGESKPPRKSVHAHQTLVAKRSCALCTAEHYLEACQQYLAKSPEQRKQFVTQQRLCFNCLGKHSRKACRCVKRCTVCQARHHSSLHESTYAQQSSAHGETQLSGSSTASSSSAMAHHVAPQLPVAQPRVPMLLATAVVKVVAGEEIHARVLLDQGSEVSFICEALCQRLRLPRRQANLPIYGIGAGHSVTTRGASTFTIASLTDPSFSCSVTAYVLPKLTSYSTALHSGTIDWPHLKGLQLADPEFLEPRPIDIVLGVDVYTQILLPDVVRGAILAPVAQRTRLGWVVSGPMSEGSESVVSSAEPSSLQCCVDHEMLELLQRFWAQEETSVQRESDHTPSEQECEDHFIRTHSRDPTGRYIVRLPFLRDPNVLGDSREAARRMLTRGEKTFANRPEFATAYAAFMREYEELGHMRRVSETEPRQQTKFFLPHHGVLRENSSGSKIRVVFNGSQRSASGTSLNDCLHTGKKLQTDVADVILRWRQYAYAFAADVEKMYRQILVHPEDQHFQQILWRHESAKPIDEYALTTVTYGLACAPFLALRCLRQLAFDDGDRFPLARPVLLHETYVDDILSGADNIPHPLQKIEHTRGLLEAGGFVLKKWIASDSALLRESQHDALCERPFNADAPHRALGLAWSARTDAFVFTYTPVPPNRITKRTVLATISQLFDPLGWLAPVVVRGKLFMQELWVQKRGWDEPLQSEFITRWERFYNDLAEIRQISIPRWIGLTERRDGVEIHGFSDASVLAMGFAVYLRVRTDDDTFRVTLISAKTKVAPIKRVTIPRLELTAALLLSRQTAHIRRVLDLANAPTHLWTDSSVALAWIRGHPAHWKEFVHNRVAEIQELIPDACWHHVPGTSNPADLASRGVSPPQLASSSLWWHGPSWLSEFSPAWPTETFTQDDRIAEEQRREDREQASLHASIPALWDLVDRYSSLSRLLRITSWCVRAARLFRDKGTTFEPIITVQELQDARCLWIKSVQQAYFADELRAIRAKTPLPKSNPLSTLTPYADPQGILRIGGRIQHSLLHPDQKHPIILPRSSTFTRLVIAHAHEEALHAGPQLTLATIRQNYWIVGGRSPIRAFVNKCVKCVRQRARPCVQIMGQLPARRVAPSRAFLHSGVDYAGPFKLRSVRGRGGKISKGYIVVFVCFATGAVHLEVVSDYTTDAFVAAYKRFTGRRGICATITSDCGTNLVGADAELRRLHHHASRESQAIANSLANLGTQWRFNSPSAPHFGGRWEAAVKSVKFHLRRVTGDTALTFEEFATLLAQIEAALNSRPMCPLSDDASDLAALTPGHFLTGDALNALPEPNLAHVNCNRLSRWQLLRQMSEHFWNRWSREYMQRFLTSPKWRTASNDVQVGALVLVIDERLPPSQWPLARVLQLHPGKDGQTRVVTLRTATTRLKRPLTKLCLLPVNDETSIKPAGSVPPSSAS